MTEQLVEVALDALESNPFQPRRTFDETAIEELAASINMLGLLQPPVIAPLNAPYRYAIIAGERRVFAMRRLGFTTTKAILRNVPAREMAELALVENIQRVDLSVIEIARSLEQLATTFRLSQEAIAKRVGKKRSTIANYMRLLSLPPTVQEALEKGGITMAHAKVLLSISDPAEQIRLMEATTQGRLSVRALTRSAERAAPRRARIGHSLESIQTQLEEKLGTRVEIMPNGDGGEIRITYYGARDLEAILEQLGD